MVERVYPTESNKATFICPKCKNTKTVDVSKFAHTTNTVKVNSRCSCGHKWTSVLEKRKQYRKKVDLPGTYSFISGTKATDRGGMKITDLSAGGVKLKLNVQRSLQVGDRLNIEFRLDDNKKTLIKKDVVVKNISDTSIGVAFRSTDPYDPVLGFYLMS
jgi:hypothetical protein